MLYPLKRVQLFATLLYFILVSSCSNKNKDEGKKNDKLQSYSVLNLTPRSATVYYDYPATVQGQQVVEIRPMVDGYLESIYVEEGASVKKGQLLFKIKNPQYEQDVKTTEAAIKIAQANVDAAKMDVEKVRPLVEKDIVSKYQLESAQYTLESKLAAMAQAKAALSNAQTNLGYTFLRSPQSGVISTIPYKIGALVSNSTADPLTTVSNISTVLAYFAMNEKQLLAFSSRHTGSTIEQKLTEIPPVNRLLADGSEYSMSGKLETASGLISTETGTASFKAVFPNPLGIIRSGASATVRIPKIMENALLVPQSATYELQDKRFVYSLNNKNQVTSVAVTASASSDGQFFVIQTGLKAGDRILLDGFNLTDSTTIIPRPVNTDSLYRPLK